MIIILLSKNALREGIKLFIVAITLINSISISTHSPSNINREENVYSYLIDQPINFLGESNYSRIKFKYLDVTFAEKFYSYDYSLNSPCDHSKLFVITAETISELNSRNSSFLISELTTST